MARGGDDRNGVVRIHAAARSAKGRPDGLPGRLPILPRHCQLWQSSSSTGCRRCLRRAADAPKNRAESSLCHIGGRCTAGWHAS
ncbi:hypothetical protein OH687_16025 [Burkholderia anthina]|nr:hypothetical protein OH687_16025 [Burkholderia anthina]